MRVGSPVVLATAGSDEVEFTAPGTLSSVSESGASSGADAGSPPAIALQSPALGRLETSVGDTPRRPLPTPGRTPNPAMVLHFDAEAADVCRS